MDPGAESAQPVLKVGRTENQGQTSPHTGRLEELPASPEKRACPPSPEPLLCPLIWSLASSHPSAGHIRSLREPPFQNPHLRAAKDKSPQGRALDPQASQIAEANSDLLARSPRPHGVLVATPGAESSSEQAARPWLQGARAFLREVGSHRASS